MLSLLSSQVAVKLQQMLEAQQALAEQYREQARRSLLQFRRTGLPPAGPEAEAPDELSPAAMFIELQAVRAREEQSRKMIAAAALVVS